jgi:hypothetical protein
MKRTTSTGTIEIIKTKPGILIRLFTKSTNHEIGITIPNKIIWSFTRRWFFQGSNESIELIVKGDNIIIQITTNFGHGDIHSSTTISRSTWSEIENEIKEMI